ncbi:hypothetical protein HKX48_001311 [Thoreauomyces humboldtii]|nr:hypothetical protein HKX48_001311 [Thoreauomyces humboldtii]
MSTAAGPEAVPSHTPATVASPSDLTAPSTPTRSGSTTAPTTFGLEALLASSVPTNFYARTLQGLDQAPVTPPTTATHAAPVVSPKRRTAESSPSKKTLDVDTANEDTDERTLADFSLVWERLRADEWRYENPRTREELRISLRKGAATSRQDPSIAGAGSIADDIRRWVMENPEPVCDF